MSRDFQFDAEVADVFDDMLERSIPFYAEIQRMTGELARQFAQPGTSIIDLGCSTGTTLVALAETIEDESIRLIGIDASRPMLEKAHTKLAAKGIAARCTLVEADLNDDFPLEKPSVVILNWTLQFVRPLNRDRVIRRICDGLENRGCLILLEKVLGEESLLNRLYIDLYYDFKRRNGYSDTEIARKRESLENVLVPYRLEENLELLSRNGFPVQDVFFRWYHWAGLLGLKLPTGA